MNDFLGNKLNVGDKVVCIERSRTAAWFVEAEIIGFTPQKVKLQYSNGRVHLKTCDKIVKK